MVTPDANPFVAKVEEKKKKKNKKKRTKESSRHVVEAFRWRSRC